MRTKLTEKFIGGLKPKSRQLYWDAEVTGLALRVSPGGTHKMFVLKYRSGAGRNARQRWFKIGRYGSEVDLASARKRARIEHGKIINGADPQGDRERHRNAKSVTDLADKFMREYAVKLRPRTRDLYQDQLVRIILPGIGRLPAKDVRRKDIYELHSKLAGTPRQANSVLALCRKLFNEAEAWEWRPDFSNPARGIKPHPEKERPERALSPAELMQLGRILEEMEEESRERSIERRDLRATMHPSAINAIRFLALTGLRRSEALSLKWTNVRFNEGTVFLEKTKTGDRTAAISTSALQLLAQLHDEEANEYVFPGIIPGQPYIGLSKAWDRIRKRAGFPNLRIHDLRHSFVSTAVSAGTSLPVAGRMVGHRSPQTTQRYAHLHDDPVRRAAEAVGNSIAAAMRGDDGEVIKFKSRMQSSR